MVRPLEAPPRRPRLLEELRRHPLLVTAVLAALSGKLVLCHLTDVDCAEAIERGDDAMIVAVCHASYARSREPREGIALANALRRTGQPSEAAVIARSLLATSAQADALYVLGKLSAVADRHDEAAEALRQALELHRRQGRHNEVAKDLNALADAADARKQFGEALRLLDECAAAARRAKAPITEGYCHVSSGKTLGRLGHHGAALHELARAAEVLVKPRDQAWVHMARGDELQEADEHAQAVVAYEQALAMAERASLQRAARSAHMNLAYSLAHTARWNEAEEHLRRAGARDDAEDELASDRWLITAMIELGRGDPLRRAAELAERAVALAERGALAVQWRGLGAARAARGPGEPVTDELIEAETLRAEIAYAHDDWSETERWARRALRHVEGLRADQPLLQLRAWVLLRHRAPQELLFSSLARAGRAEAALEAFDSWMARASSDALTFDTDGAKTPGPLDAKAASAAGFKMVAQGAELERLLPLLHQKQQARVGLPRQRLTRSSLLALVVARGQLWRLVRDKDITSVEPLGALAELQLPFDQLRSNPANRPLAEALGERLLPAAQAVATSQILHLVLDEPLAYLPMAALRRGDRRLGELRPLVRASRPSHLACAQPQGSVRFPDLGSARLAVIADADGSLPGARREAEELGELAPHATVSLGKEATQRAVYAAGDGDILHLAVHSDVDELGGKLRLADGPLSALAMAGSGRAPARVVLATCGSALSFPGTYSLAMAFLAAGAEQVLATVRPIPDEEAARVTAALYRTGAADLVTALWRAQASSDGGEAQDLSSFAVFGEALCDSHGNPRPDSDRDL